MLPALNRFCEQGVLKARPTSIGLGTKNEGSKSLKTDPKNIPPEKFIFLFVFIFLIRQRFKNRRTELNYILLTSIVMKAGKYIMISTCRNNV